MAANEHVLCILKNKLPEPWIRQKSILTLTLDEFIKTCSTAGFEFISRAKAESDPALKQIIPYIVLQTQDRKKTAIYDRNGREKRLHDLCSIGIGGHINPIDINADHNDFKSILATGMQRELDEELCQSASEDQPEFMGVISEDITDVGKVHLGAVFRILTDRPDAYIPGEELFNFDWVKTSTLEDLNLELWSQLALELIKKN